MNFRTLLNLSIQGLIGLASLILLVAILQSCRDMGGPAYMSADGPAFEAEPPAAVVTTDEAPVTSTDESLTALQIRVR